MPLWASAICRLNTSPIPEPPRLVVKKGTNRLVVLARPGPSSRTRISTPFGRTLMLHKYAARCLARGIHRIADQVDEHLFELIAVALDG